MKSQDYIKRTDTPQDQSPQGALKRARLSGVVDPEDLDLEKTRIRIVKLSAVHSPPLNYH